MAFDGVFTHYLVNELNQNLLNGRINKIYQISNYELVLVIRANSKTQKLLISINPNYARVHITENNYTYPQEPPMFCMLLRKHLEGGIITEIKQKDNDRIILIDVLHINEIGDKDIKQLIIEIMGKHSNIVLLNKTTNNILDCIKHISPFQNSVRTLQPGAQYIYPPTNKINFFNAKKADFDNINYLESNISKQLVNLFEGVSPICANEIVYNAHYNNSEALNNSYMEFVRNLNNNLNPTIIYTPNKQYFYLVPLNSIPGEFKNYQTIGQMLDRYFFNKDSQERIKQQTQDLEKYIKNELEKNKNKLHNLKTDLLVANNSDMYKLYGELIMTYSYSLQKGMTICELENYYSELKETIKIDLDPLLTPIENSQKYFNKYQKAKKAIVHINEQINLTIHEIEYFETIYEQMQNANLTDALEIRQELEEGKYLKRNVSKQKKNNKPQYETYLIDGIEILVGKNNIQNEYLTHKLASKNEMWMHAKDMPGSHVIIRSDKELSENVIRTGAILAAYYSKGKQSSSVPIDYTKVKNVKKIPGAKPGFVTYDNQKTIFIDPDEDFIHSLNKK